MERQHGFVPAMAVRVHGPTAAELAGTEHHEMVGGELVEKAWATIRHGLVQGNLISALHGFVGPGRGAERPGGWWIGPEVTIAIEPGEIYQPDIAGWHMERLHARLDEWPVCVLPDWVCEILSPSTARQDLGHKPWVHHRARVEHYWVADPIHHLMTVYRWRADRYVLTGVAGAGDVVRVEPFAAVELDIADIFGSSQE